MNATANGRAAIAHDLQEIRRALQLLFEPGDVVELRALSRNSRGFDEIFSGYYDDHDLLTQQAAAFNAKSKNVYVTVNPVKPELLARRANRCEGGKVDSTQDSHIIRRRWLLIDCDPVRPTGIAASDAEHDAGLQLAQRIAESLRDQPGWPEPIYADSGNGGHLLYRVDLPNDAASTSLIGRALNRIATEFAGDHVKVDTSVGNAARIWRLYGCVNRKGDNVPDRPHRLSRIISAPATCGVVTQEQLERFAPHEAVAEARKAKRTHGDFDLGEWIRGSGLEIREQGDYANGNGAIYRWKLATCPLCGESDKSAIVMKMSDGRAAYKCQHNRCSGKGWKELREAVEPGYAERGQSRTRSRRDEEVIGTGRLPELQLPGGDQTISDAGAAAGKLLRVKRTHFLRGGACMRVDADDSGSPVLSPVKPAELASDLEQVAQLVKVIETKDGAITKPTTCSESAAKLLLASQAFLRELPRLRLLSPCPVLTERGGNLVEVSGYDEASGILAAGAPPEVVDLDEARRLLTDALSGFRFATPADRSRALAAMITPALVFGGLLRGRSPVDLGEADQSQTGKGYRNKITAAVYGHSPVAISQQHAGVGSLEEAFDRALIAGKTFIAIDNVRGKVDSQKIESFLTENTYYARCAYMPNTEIDPRRVYVMFTSNKADMTVDLANRSSCVRILKQPDGYQFPSYPEGDVLVHISTNQPRYIGAVFAIMRAWYAAGKPRTTETRHDFRAWAQTLDWIVQNLLGAAPLMDGHRETQQRMTNPALNWLRDVALALVRQGKSGRLLIAADLLEAMDADGSIDVPGLREGADLEDEATRLIVLRQIGRKLGRCFGDSDQIKLDDLTVERSTVTDEQFRLRHRYVVTKNTERTPPPRDPQENGAGQERVAAEAPVRSENRAPDEGKKADPRTNPQETPKKTPNKKSETPEYPETSQTLKYARARTRDPISETLGSVSGSWGSSGVTPPTGERERDTI